LYQRSVITMQASRGKDPAQRVWTEAGCSRRGNSDPLCFV
jgi:hypothetical protein